MNRHQYRGSQEQNNAASTERDVQTDRDMNRDDDTDMSEKGSEDMQDAR